MEQEGLQTLYLMNPGYSGYGDTPPAANIFLLNSAAAAVAPSLNTLSHSGAAPATNTNIQQFFGIPLHPTASASDPNHEMTSLQAFTSNLNHSLWSSAMPPHQHQGLSLSLSPSRRVSIASTSAATELSNGVSDIQNFWMGSKYLKVAQQLLDEVVSVDDGIKGELMKASESKSQARPPKEAESGKNEKPLELTTAERQDLQMKNTKLVNMLEEVEHRYKQYHHHMQTVVSSFEAAIGNGAARTYTALALQTISKQFRCLKDAIAEQIRSILKSLGEEGGLGGEDRSPSGSRLRLIDQQLRQQRAFQQIGMMQHSAWRPQRGLPERSVSILRAWLFEHFLHPYPKDSDKQMLAKQTGLTRSQVSNWFINARVRLWKPMVEEMYLEELKGEEQSNGRDENSSKSNTNGESTSKPNANQDIISPPAKTDRTNHQLPAFSLPHSALLINGDQEYMQPNQKRVKGNEPMHSNVEFGPADRDDGHELMMKFGRGLQCGEERSHGYSLMSRKTSNGNVEFSSSSYSMGQPERLSEDFSPRIMNKNVSLTLGLPHHGDNLPLSRGHQSFLSNERIQLGRRVELSSSNNNEASSAVLSSSFEDINLQGRKRFAAAAAAAAQLLPDFVA